MKTNDSTKSKSDLNPVSEPATDSAEMHPDLENASHAEPVVLCNLNLDDIMADDGIQTRAAIDNATVEAYAEHMKMGDTFPAIIVFFDGQSYRLADGFHRLRASRIARRQQISVEIRQGTRRDTLRFAIGANASHGLRRSNADKRRAVQLALQEFPEMSDRAIAAMAKVSAPLIHTVRRELKILTVGPRTGLDGKKRIPSTKTSPPMHGSGKEDKPTANRPSGKPTARSPKTKEPLEHGHRQNSAVETIEQPDQRPGLPYVPQVCICSLLVSAIGLASYYDRCDGSEERRADLERLLVAFGSVTSIPTRAPDAARQPQMQSNPI